MKKYVSFALSLLLSAALLSGCAGGSTGSSSSSTPAESTPASSAPAESAPESAPAESTPETSPVDVRVAALKGPTAMGMVKLMADAQQSSPDGNNYTFTIAGSADEITPKLVQGEVDISAVPANLAAVLYNNTEGQVRVLAINTLGVLYIVESGDTVQSVEDLRGTTIYASGKGATPEYALNYLLTANGIDPEQDVTIEWRSEHTECVAALTAQENAIAMLPQPFVTTAQQKDPNIRIALDMTREWDAAQASAQTPSALLTGVVVARTDFIEQHPEAVNAFLDSYKASVEYVNANTTDAAALIEQFDIVPAAVAEKALPYCNITFIEGDALKQKLGGYLSVLMEQNPKSIGGSLPDDAFYYSR